MAVYIVAPTAPCIGGKSVGNDLVTAN